MGDRRDPLAVIMNPVWEKSHYDCVKWPDSIAPPHTFYGLPTPLLLRIMVHILLNFLWDSMALCGNSHRKDVGMGWEWELKFHSHGNPGIELMYVYNISNVFANTSQTSHNYINHTLKTFQI